jgi:hypothetical protein
MARFLGPQPMIPLRRRFLLRALVETAVCLFSRSWLAGVFDPAPDQGYGLTGGMTAGGSRGVGISLRR